MKIEVLKSTVSDNYFYLLVDDGQAMLIDPIDPDVAKAAVEASGATLNIVFNTHFHPDHVGGDDAVLGMFPDAELVVAAGDIDYIRNLVDAEPDRLVSDGDTVSIGGASLAVLDTPGHTGGHVSLLHDTHLISGDCIFASGAGHCKFGGDPSQFYTTYRDVFAPLADDVTYYPGHDYAVRNLEFALHLQPGLNAAAAALEQAQGDSTLRLRTLGEEREFNPFFRFDSPDLQEALQTRFTEDWEAERAQSGSDDEAAFRTTRRLRNSW